MCLITVQPPGVPLSLDLIHNAWTNGNNDGAGYMYAINGRLRINKGFMKWDDFAGAYELDRSSHPDVTFVSHLRLATHGTKDAQMTHPYSLANGMVGLVHNGVLSKFGGYNGNGLSDTLEFAWYVMSFRHPKNIMDQEFAKHLGRLIGSSNKFVLLDHRGELRIINEDAGHWKDGLWFSNKNYEPRTLYIAKSSADYGGDEWHERSSKIGSKRTKKWCKYKDARTSGTFEIEKIRILMKIRPSAWDANDWQMFFRFHGIWDEGERTLIAEVLKSRWKDKPPYHLFTDREIEIMIENTNLESELSKSTDAGGEQKQSLLD